jgi:hypothetical protein
MFACTNTHKFTLMHAHTHTFIHTKPFTNIDDTHLQEHMEKASTALQLTTIEQRNYTDCALAMCAAASMQLHKSVTSLNWRA